MIYGYARVSTADQDTALQRDALRRAGVRTVVEEKRSGVRTRPALERLLDMLQPGDVLVVYKVDRLARSLRDLVRILDRVSSSGAGFRSVTEPINTDTPAGQLVLHMLAAVAQFEWSLIRERAIAGQTAARERGVRIGRPEALHGGRLSMAVRLVRGGASFTAVGLRLGVSRSTVRRAVARVARSGGQN